MESKAIKLAKKIATILKNADYDDAQNALKIAKIMLPTPSAQRKKEQEKDKEQERSDQQEESAGSLEPADQYLMKVSKAMGRSIPAVQPETEIDDESELQ